MSEKKEYKWQVFLFVLLAAAVIFMVGLFLIVAGYNTYFNYLYYGDALLYTIFSAISYLGEPVPLIIVILILWYGYDKKFAKNLGLSLLGSYYFSSILKDIFKDPRPATNLDETGYGFPSSHAHNAVAAWGYIANEAYNKKNKYIPVIAIILIYLISISRVIIGVHDIQDIWGGALLGMLFLTIFILLEPTVSKGINKFNFILKLVLAIVIPIVLFAIALLAFPATEGAFGLICGAFLGLSCGYLIEGEYIKYNPSELNMKNKIINIAIGIVLTLVLYLGLSLVPLDIQIWDFIQYFIITIILVSLLPWLFTKINK